MSDRLRLRFRKIGRAVYISHLDLMNTMQRALSRAGYELKYSEGFSPHPHMSILLPLSVGAASECEIMDFRLYGETDMAELPARLTAALPEGIEIIECYEPLRKPAELKYLEIEGRMDYDLGGCAEKAEALAEFFSAESISVEKKTKRGMELTDIKPAIRSIAFTPGDGQVALRAVISAQQPTLNPELLCAALRRLSPGLAPDFAKFTRIETYCADMELYR